MDNMNEQRVIVLNDCSDVTEDIKARILNNDLDVLQINYNCNGSSSSPFTRRLNSETFSLGILNFKTFFSVKSVKTPTSLLYMN